MLTKTDDDGRTLFIDERQFEPGRKGGFYVVYRSTDRENLWGYYCSNCTSFNEAEGPIWKLACHECGNTRKTE